MRNAHPAWAMPAEFFSDSVGEFAKAVHYIGARQQQAPLPPSGTVPYSRPEALRMGAVEITGRRMVEIVRSKHSPDTGAPA